MEIAGTQKEVKKVAAPPKADNKLQIAEKLEAGFRYVTIESEDLYNYKFDGIWINQDHYKPGTHLVSSDIADTLEDRLQAWRAYNVRLMRPQADKKSLEDLGNKF